MTVSLAETATPARTSVASPAAGSPLPIVQRALAVLMRPAALGILGQATLSAANFVTAVLIGRACGDEGLGVYSLAMGCVLIGIGVQVELTSSPYHVYCIRRRGSALARYTGSVLMHQVVLTAFLMLAGTAVLAATGQLSKLLPVLGTLLWAAPLLMTREFLRQMTFARLRLGLSVLLDLAAAVVQVSLVASLWLAGWLQPRFGLMAAAAGGATMLAIWLTRNRREVALRGRHAWLHWRRNWSFGRWTVATYLVGSTLPFLMPWALAAWHAVDAAGQLAACNNLIGLSYMFTTGIANALTGQAARDFRTGGRQQLQQRLRQAAGVIVVVLVPFIGGVAWLGNWAIEFVNGPEFAGLGTVSMVVACGVLATGLSMVAGNGLWAIERPQDGFIADVVTLAVAALAAVWLVPKHAVLGAALATLAGQSAGMVVRLVCLRRSLARLPASRPSQRQEGQR